MKLVLAFSVLFVVVYTVRSDVQCGNTNFCQVGFRPFQSRSSNEFKTTRRVAEELRLLTNSQIIGVHNHSKLFVLVRKQDELCSDDTIGFLLDDNNQDYQVSCVWTGVSQYGQCQAVPAKYASEVYSFVPGDIWHKKLQKVRRDIGCFQGILEFPSNSTSGNINTRRNALSPHLNSEAYICNERCVQAGIGYLPAILIILTLAISFFRNCAVPE